jgi:hypothetical protein
VSAVVVARLRAPLPAGALGVLASALEDAYGPGLVIESGPDAEGFFRVTNPNLQEVDR